MLTTRTWPVSVFLTESEGHTHAEAVLNSGAEVPLRGTGSARCNPADQDVPEIGDELATARALADLSAHLLRAAADDVAAVLATRTTA